MTNEMNATLDMINEALNKEPKSAAEELKNTPMPAISFYDRFWGSIQRFFNIRLNARDMLDFYERDMEKWLELNDKANESQEINDFLCDELAAYRERYYQNFILSRPLHTNLPVYIQIR